jgi:hypothetical protein
VVFCANDPAGSGAAPHVSLDISMKTFFKFGVARLGEASSIRGAILLLSAVGITLRPELQDAIIAAGLALAGLVGVLAPDAPGTPAE